MKGEEMSDIRAKHQLDRVAFGRLLGHIGNDNTVFTRIRAYEQERRQIPLTMARLVYLIGLCPKGRIPPFPNWPGYTLEEKELQQRRFEQNRKTRKERKRERLGC